MMYQIFVRLTPDSGNTIISIDGDGVQNGTSFTNVVILDSVINLDIQTMISGDNLIL